LQASDAAIPTPPGHPAAPQRHLLWQHDQFNAGRLAKSVQGDCELRADGLERRRLERLCQWRHLSFHAIGPDLGTIVTTGRRAIALVAQSIGGGGGLLAAPQESIQTVNFDNEATGIGGDIQLTFGNTGSNDASITTYGDGAWGMLAQSIGGGGGFAGTSPRRSAASFHRHRRQEGPARTVVTSRSTSTATSPLMGRTRMASLRRA
jgi:hypothetical protein